MTLQPQKIPWRRRSSHRALDKSELEHLVELISQRVGRCLERLGLLEQDAERLPHERSECFGHGPTQVAFPSPTRHVASFRRKRIDNHNAKLTRQTICSTHIVYTFYT